MISIIKKSNNALVYLYFSHYLCNVFLLDVKLFHINFVKFSKKHFSSRKSHIIFKVEPIHHPQNTITIKNKTKH